MRNRTILGATILAAAGLIILALATISRNNAREQKLENVDTSGAEPALPNFIARVRSVYPQLGFVTLEGKETLDLAKNSDLEVVRNGLVVARLKVTTVEGNLAAADIVPGSVADGESLRVGDAVALNPIVVRADPRVQAADRKAKGRVANIDSTWGFVIIDDLQGSPQRGDEAYLQRLGPAGGLMTIDSVEPSQLVLSAGNPMLQELKTGDRIATRPPAIAKVDAAPK